MAPVRRATEQDRPELESLHKAYLEALTAHGLEVTAHDLEEAWFTDTERLFPLVLSEEVGLAGYMLVFGPEYSRAMGFEVDSYVHELFVREDLRGRGRAGELLDHALGERPGTWAVEVLEANGPASRFWSRALAGRAGLRDEVRGEFRVYWFES